MKKTIPAPGSKEAIEKGCNCPILDNSYGKGYYGKKGIYVITIGCPLHDKKKNRKKKERQ